MKPNWITRLIFAAATLTLVVLGVFFLTVALAVGAVVAAVIGVRFWWALRKRLLIRHPLPATTRWLTANIA